MPTSDLVLQYPAKAEAPPFYQAFDPSAGFPWPRTERPTLPRKRPVWGASVLDTTYVTGNASLDPSVDGFPWPRTERPTPAKRPNVATGYIALANVEYVPFEDKTHSWLPTFPDFARTRKPLVNTGYSVLQLEASQFLGEPWLSWYRQPVEPIVKVRRPLVNEGRYVFGNEEVVPYEQKTHSWLPTFPDRIYGRKPLVNVGWTVYDFTEAVVNVFDPTAMSWWHQASEPIVKKRRPLTQTGIVVRGVPTELLLGDPYLSWYRQPVERPAVARRPLVREGIIRLSNDVYVPFQEKTLSWYRQPSERLHRRRPFYYQGFIAYVSTERDVFVVSPPSGTGYFFPSTGKNPATLWAARKAAIERLIQTPDNGENAEALWAARRASILQRIKDRARARFMGRDL